MKLTNEQEKEMKRVFPNGYEESDIPAFIREREEKKEKLLTGQLFDDGKPMFMGVFEN